MHEAVVIPVMGQPMGRGSARPGEDLLSQRAIVDARPGQRVTGLGEQVFACWAGWG